MFDRSIVAAVALVIFATAPARADDHDMHSMPGMQHRAAQGAASPEIDALNAANEKMHRDMAVPLTGDGDRDFVTSMIPHHQGAIDMANVVLKYGKDPQIRQLAMGIIKAQQREIAEMKAWLAKHPAP